MESKRPRQLMQMDFVNGLNADVVEELISDDSSEALIQDSGADSDQSAAALENANAEAARL